MTAPRAALVALALLASAPARAASQVRHEETISVSSAWDSNARRVDAGPLVTQDVLAQVFATGRLAWRDGGTTLGLGLQLGGKRFALVHAEDVGVGRVTLSLSHLFGRSLVLSLDGNYKDAFQRGDLLSSLPKGSPLACVPPDGLSTAGYRCNRRDLREGGASAHLGLRIARGLVLSADAGGDAFQYKPNPMFSYAGPAGGLSLRWNAARGVVLGLFGDAALHTYDPSSTTYRIIDDNGTRKLYPTGIPRVEAVYDGGLTFAYRGPMLVSARLSLARSVNNGAGMDVWRGRLEVAAAAFVGPRTTVAISAAFQAALWPQGDVYRDLTPIGDESEQENSLAIKLAQHLTDHLSAVLKIAAYGNEFSAQARPFSRQVIQTGLEYDL